MKEEYEDLCELAPDVPLADDDPVQQISVFDLANDIMMHGSLIEQWVREKGEMPPQWNGYMILRIFAQHPDTLLFANEMNKHWQLPDEMVWRFLKNLVVKKKRYGWTKKTRREEEKEPITLLAEYFGCTEKEMRKNIHAIPKDRLMRLLETLDPERWKPKKAKAAKPKKQGG